MNTPDNYGGNVVQLGRTINMMRAAQVAPMWIDAKPEDFGPNVNCGSIHDDDAGFLAAMRARMIVAWAAGCAVAMLIIAVLP